MNLISMDGVSKSQGGVLLFENVSMGIESCDRIGFVGRNGCGKSTFLKLLSGTLESDSGTIARKRSLSVSMLEQIPEFEPRTSLRDFLFSGDSPSLRLVRDYEDCLDSVHSGAIRDAAYYSKLATLTARMEEGGFAVERRFCSLLSEFGLPDPGTPMNILSGGMAKKAAIARALSAGSDLLLLDEPTNHLDIEAIEKLERTLVQAGFAFILVTHDRRFLDAVCTHVMDIDRRTVSIYPGNYSSYLERRIERAAAMERGESRRISILRVELEWLNRGAQARATKNKGHKDRIARMMEDAPDKVSRMEEFSSSGRRLGRKVLELHDVSKSYGGVAVLQKFSYSFTRGERIGVVGPNGSGKTTLLDIASGRLESDSGSVQRGDTLTLGYYGQTNADILKEQTVLEYVLEHASRLHMADGAELAAEQLLERFLFPRDMFERTLSRLSGGELRRLRLVRLLLESPNFLVLDEPTNDLDIDTIELLEDFLDKFEGCVLSVSHDRAFLERVADRLFILDASGSVEDFAGDYDAWRSMAEERAAQELASTKKEKAGLAAQAKADGRQAGPTRKLSYAERKEYERLLEEISILEGEKKKHHEIFSGTDALAIQEASKRYAALDFELEAALKRWEELAILAE